MGESQPSAGAAGGASTGASEPPGALSRPSQDPLVCKVARSTAEFPLLNTIDIGGDFAFSV